MLQIASSGFPERSHCMMFRRAIIAIIAVMAVMNTTVFAATVQPTVAAVEVTSNKTEEKATKYPKSLQVQLLESKDNNKEVARAMGIVKSLQANTAKVDSYGVAWKLADSKDIAKVRVKAGSIDFQWTPVFAGYAWISDLSMWSNRSLLGKEATLYFLDKESTVLWSTTVVFPKELKVPEVNTGKEEIVPPCPNMAPTASAKESVEIGIAPGSNKK